MKCVVAFSSKYTAYSWIKLQDYKLLSDACRYINQILPDMPNSAIAIFIETESTSWRDRKPKYIYNRHALYSGEYNSQLAGLINSVNSDFTINRAKGGD